MALETELTRRLGIAAPVILAPMAGVAGGALAAAVSRAGGLGLIGGGYGDRTWLTDQLRLAGDAPIGVGFISWALETTPDLLRLALDQGPRAIFLSFGSIRPFAPIVRRTGATLIAQVQTLDDAKIAIAEGAQVIVAQGTEAGGHGGGRSTMSLVPAVVDVAGTTPVVAAGGIADGRGLAAALMLGATGVVCGTAFYASHEALSHPNAKNRAISASGDETTRGSTFDVARRLEWPKPWTLRSLENAFSRQWRDEPLKLQNQIDQVAPTYARAEAVGNIDTAAVVVGEAVDLVRSSESAAAIVANIIRDAENRLQQRESATRWAEP